MKNNPTKTPIKVKVKVKVKVKAAAPAPTPTLTPASAPAPEPAPTLALRQNIRPRVSVRLRHLPRVLLAAILALTLAAPTFTFPQDAFAEVQKTDVVGTDTMQNRGITATDMPSIDAKYAYVADANGTVYFERNANEHTQIASITKIMCALVAIQNGRLDDVITVSENAASVGESSAGLQAGDTLTLEQALKALMIPSGNDAATAIAESIGKKLISADTSADADSAALAAFVAKMNETAADLGCTDTTFTNPHGLDEDEFDGDLHSSAADVYKIARAAMQYEAFSEIVKLPQATIDITRDGATVQLALTSTDELLGQVAGMCGIKTGFTDKAGPCFAGACERDGRMLYVIVLNSSSESARFTDCETLIDWVFGNMVGYKLANTTQYTQDANGTDVPVVAKVSIESWPDKTVDATFTDYNETIEVFKLFGNVSQEIELYTLSGTVLAGQEVGVAKFYQQNKLIAQRALVAVQTVDAPGFFESIGIWWSRVIANLRGEPTAASSQIYNTTPLVFSK